MKVINLFGGPGTGKSTTASDLFAAMKWRNMNVELVGEYAKDLQWDKRFNIFEDQLYITAKQNRKLHRLRDQVEYVVTDSPILLGLAYAPPGYLPSYNSMVHELFDTYDNLNIFLVREKPYHAVGRNQTADEAKKIDSVIQDILDVYNYPYVTVPANQYAKDAILELL